MKSPQNPRRQLSLHATARLVVGFFLEVLMVFVGLIPTWDYGVYDKTKFWYAANNFFAEFLMVFLPTITILFLLPVIIRGSGPQKILAIILSLLPAWLAFNGWQNVIYRFMENP